MTPFHRPLSTTGKHFSDNAPTQTTSSSPSSTTPRQDTTSSFASRRLAQEDPDHIDRQTTEQTKSSTDNAVSETDVAFDSSSRPEHARAQTGQVLEVSSANPEVSKHSIEATKEEGGALKEQKGEQSTTTRGPVWKSKSGHREDIGKKEFKGFDRRSKEQKQEQEQISPGSR